MLMLQTGVPPPVLAILWEFVNCTKVGQLTSEEFAALLALISRVQVCQPPYSSLRFAVLQLMCCNNSSSLLTYKLYTSNYVLHLN